MTTFVRRRDLHRRRRQVLDAMPEPERTILQRHARRLQDAVPNMGPKSALELLEALGIFMQGWDEEFIRELEAKDVRAVAQD